MGWENEALVKDLRERDECKVLIGRLTTVDAARSRIRRAAQIAGVRVTTVTGWNCVYGSVNRGA